LKKSPSGVQFETITLEAKIMQCSGCVMVEREIVIVNETTGTSP